MPAPTHILLVNVHSALNLGDDAIMSSTLTTLRAVYPHSKITIAATDPDSWRCKYDAIDIVGSLTAWVVDRTNGGWRWQKSKLPIYAALLGLAVVAYRVFHTKWLFGLPEQRRLLRAYYAADLVLSCGGGNFYAHRRLSPALLWAFLTLGLGMALGKSTILLPQSIGPIEGRFQRWLARRLFNRPTKILLREQQSAAFLRVLQIHRAPVVLADLAFALPPAPDNFSVPPMESERLRIGITVMDRGAQDRRFRRQAIYEDALVSLLIRLHAQYDVHLYIFCQCYGPSPDQDDRQCARRIYERVRQQVKPVTLLDSFSDALEIRSAYRAMTCVIGTRMHAGIFALSQGVPAILIGYQPKALGSMSLFGLERYSCDIERITGDELYQVACEVLAQRQELVARIAERYRGVQDLLRDWADYLRV